MNVVECKLFDGSSHIGLKPLTSAFPQMRTKEELMLLSEAKTYIGKVCTIRFLDRSGQEHEVTSLVYDATYVPLYGGYIVTDMDDIRLDRVNSVELVGENTVVGVEQRECLAA